MYVNIKVHELAQHDLSMMKVRFEIGDDRLGFTMTIIICVSTNRWCCTCLVLVIPLR